MSLAFSFLFLIPPFPPPHPPHFPLLLCPISVYQLHTPIGAADANDRNRLRNIEATEKAKREMLEARSAKPKATERSKKPNESEESYAGARCMSSFLHCITPFLFLLPITFVFITTDHDFEIQRRTPGPRQRQRSIGGKREN